MTKFSGEPPIFPDGSPKDFSTSTTYPWDTCPPWYNTFLQSASPVTPPTATQGKDEEALAAQLKDDLKLSSEMRKRVAQHLLSHQYTGFDSRGRPHIPGGLVPGCADLIRSFGRADSEQKNKLKVLFIIGQEHRAQEVGSPEAYFRSRPTAKADFDPILAAEPRAMCLENTRKVPSSDKRRQSSLMLAYHDWVRVYLLHMLTCITDRFGQLYLSIIMKKRWDVEYISISNFAAACTDRRKGPGGLWDRMVDEFNLIMGGVDYTANFAYEILQ